MNRTSAAGTGRWDLGRYFRAWLACAALAFAPIAAAGVDAVLLMDSSGSMAKNDPHKLRVPAAKLFMSLLGSDDRIGLISFSDNGYPVLRLTAPQPGENPRLLASADKVSSKGVYTNLYAAVRKGTDMLAREGRPDQEKMLILMSDGKMDVGDNDEDWRLSQRLQGELSEALKAQQIKVYSIAFTEASDVELLQSVAQKTGGLFKLAKTDADLHEVFSDIFETAKAPDMLPIDGGEFSVDPSIEEVTIVASKEREDVRIYLQSPQGRKLGAEDAGDNLKWFLSEHFDMITLRQPQAGTWKLLFTGGKNRAYIVTDMSLKHNPQLPNVATGAHVVIESWLEQEGKLLDKEALLTNTRFHMLVQTPDGAEANFELFDNGQYGDRETGDAHYSNTLAFDNPGAYSIELIAESQTFKRQKTLHFEVKAPTENTPAAAPAAPESAAAEPAETTTPAPAAPSEAPVTEPQPQTPEEAAPEPAPVETPPAAKKEVHLGLAIGVFIGVNLLLVALGFGLWWFLKKRKRAAEAQAESDDDDADEAPQ